MVLLDADEVTPGWLTDVLRRNGTLPQGEVVAVEKNVMPTNTAAVARKYDVTVSFTKPTTQTSIPMPTGYSNV
mgnify:CR=1 FL=1